MIEIFVAKTVEEAKEQAVSAFGAPASEIRFEILEQPRRGLFGKLKGEAKVKAEYEPLMQQTPVREAPAAPVSAPAPQPAPAVSQPEAVAETPAAVPAEQPVAEQTAEAAAPAEALPETEAVPVELSEEQTAKAEHARSYVASILRSMGLSDASTMTVTESGVTLTFDGDGSGTIIGRRGETLDALQYLASMVSNKGDKEYFRISIDSCGYREKRRKTLIELAHKISRSVLRTGRSTTLEPMNPYERRIIHSAVSEIEGVTSRSTGEEPYRKVIISSTNPRKGGERRGRNDRDRRRRNPDGPRKLDLATSFEKDYKRPKPEDELNAGLYGKIEF
ncbi:RNA-binding cell elongation regulator Jag/EloR [uncultured Ruminococcus sp.]|uniref:RNA-binding cell elongation regulator Jag/EloR n=1 Tax=uncultured Ruminococcus sp. TaxID=165186 RepID=UPI0025D8F7FD|nr:RNA-binding cell elongation regulator Jag/EloR [uncultured Ruminococcus sp.]